MRSNEPISTDEPLAERIAEEILARQRQGERPTLEEYCQQYPEHSEELRSFLPALMAVEGLKPNSADVSDAFGSDIEITGKRREFIGDYRILRELGRGGMGVVYEAEQKSLGRHVALKVLLRSVAGDARAAKRFESEAKAAARMHHTNIVPVFDVGSDDEHLYYAMQLIQGQALDLVVDDLKQLRNLRGSSSPAALDQAKAQDKSIARSLAAGQFHQDQLLEHTQDSSLDAPEVEPIQAPSPLAPLAGRGVGGEGAFAVTETLDARTGSSHSAVMPGQRDMSSAEGNRPAYFLSVARIGHQTAEALAYAHARGIIHRDIKPANLLLDGSGIVWITDFGLAKTGDHGMTHTGDILGTIRYMSPERFRGQCDVRADIYSLGLTLYELLTLQPAFSAADQLKLIDRIVKSEPPAPRTLDASVPRDLETIVLKCIDKDPRCRYQSADELSEDLDRFIHEEPVKARRISLPERVGRWSRRNKAMAASLAVVASLLLIINIAGPLVTLRMARLKNDAIQAELKAEKRADLLNRNLYISNVHLAGIAASSPTGIKQVAALTEQWIPQPGDPDLRGWEWYYLRSLMHKSSQTFTEHTNHVSTVAWSPVSHRLASLSADGTIKIWELDTEAVSLPSTLKGLVAARGTRYVDWSPDGNMIATGFQNAIRIYDSHTGDTVKVVNTAHNAGVSIVSWSPDCRHIASACGWGSGEQTIQVCNIVTGHVDAIEAPYQVTTVAWSPDGKTLASGGHSGEGPRRAHLTLWAGEGWQEPTNLPVEEAYVWSIAWSPDGTRLAACYPGGSDVTIYETSTAQILTRLAVPSSALSVAWSPDGTRFAAGLATRLISVWNTGHDAEEFDELLLLQGHTGRVQSVAWSPDSKQIASGSHDTTVKVWDVQQLLDANAKVKLAESKDPANSILWIVDGHPLPIIDSPGVRKLWNTRSNEPLRVLEAIHRSRETVRPGWMPVSLSPDGRHLATTTSDGIGWWDTATGKLQEAWELPARPTMLAWCPESQKLASASFHENVVRVFKAVTGQKELVLDGHTHGVHAIAWSPDGSRLATGGSPGDSRTLIWDTNSGKSLHELPGRRGSVYALAWSPDGKTLASGGEDDMVYLWKAATGEKQHDLLGHVDRVTSLAWSPDGTRLASAGKDQAVIVWDPEMGRETLSMKLDEGDLTGSVNGMVTWGPDSQRLAIITREEVKILDASLGYADEQKRLHRTKQN